MIKQSPTQLVSVIYHSHHPCAGAGLCYLIIVLCVVGSGGHKVDHQTVNRGDGGSIPPAAV